MKTTKPSGDDAGAGDLVQIKRVTELPTQFKVQGFNGPYQTRQLPAFIGLYQRNQNLPVSGSVKAAMDKRAAWANRAGYASCEEFSYKVFDKLARVEDIVAANPANVRDVFSKIVYDDALFREGFARIPFLQQSGLFKSRQTLANEPLINTLGSQIDNWPQDRTVFLGDPRNWPRNSFLNRDPRGFWYPGLQSGESVHPWNPQLLTKIAVHKDEKKSLMADDQLSYSQLFAGAHYSDDYLEELQEMQVAYEKLLSNRDLVRVGYEVALFNLNMCRANPFGNCGAAEQALAETRKKSYDSLRWLDSQIEQLLVRADRHRCLDGTISACDWSPRLMRLTLESSLSRYRDYREAVGRFCEKITDLRLNPLKGAYLAPKPLFKFIADKLGTAGQWRDNPQAFQQYFVKAAEYYILMAAEMAEIRSSAKATRDGHPELGDLDSDSGFFGTEFFGEVGGGYEYRRAWLLSDYEQNLCSANYRAEMSYKVYGKLFGETVKAMRFEGALATSESGSAANATLLVQNNVLDPGDFKTVGTPYSTHGGTDYHFTARPEAAETLASVSAYVPVFGVPVKLSTGVVAGVGFNMDVTNQIDRAQCGVQSEPDFKAGGVFMKTKGEMTPHGRLSVNASASVDASIGEIGIRGRLNLVQVGLPWTVDNVFASRTQPSATPRRLDDKHPTFYSSSRSSLQLNALSGGISAFLEVPFKTFEKDLLSWPGFTHRVPLDEENMNFSLYFTRKTLIEGVEPPPTDL